MSGAVGSSLTSTPTTWENFISELGSPRCAISSWINLFLKSHLGLQFYSVFYTYFSGPCGFSSEQNKPSPCPLEFMF